MIASVATHEVVASTKAAERKAPSGSSAQARVAPVRDVPQVPKGHVLPGQIKVQGRRRELIRRLFQDFRQNHVDHAGQVVRDHRQRQVVLFVQAEDPPDHAVLQMPGRLVQEQVMLDHALTLKGRVNRGLRPGGMTGSQVVHLPMSLS